MGDCASCGGIYNNYAIVQGVDEIIPVDVYIAGCPPRPEQLMHGVLTLHQKIHGETIMGLGRGGAACLISRQRKTPPPRCTPPCPACCWRRTASATRRPLVVAPQDLLSVCRFLRNSSGLVYNFLSDISAVDYWPEQERPERFGICYHLLSMLYSRRLRVKIFVAEDEADAPSLTSVWPAANWLEREIFDLMGIHFSGHPDLRRILMPADWDGHPMRRDYPLGYEQVQFSFNAEEIMKHKPFAKE